MSLYAHYPIPYLPVYDTVQQCRYSSDLYLKSSKIDNRIPSITRRNNNRTSSAWKRKKKRLRSKRHRKGDNKQTESDNFHQRNMITVRQISCQDMLDAQMRMNKRSDYETINLHYDDDQNKWKRKSQPYKSSRTKTNTPSPRIEIHTPNVFKSSSTIHNRTKTLSTPKSTTLFQQQELEKKISNPRSITTSKHDMSASSLVSTQILADTYSQTKADVPITLNTVSDPQNDLKSLVENSSPHRSTTEPSIVPHFSSTIAPYVPHHLSSTTTTITPKVSEPQSTIVSTITKDNIQDLVDQLRACIVALNLLLQNKTKHGKYIISNGKSSPNRRTYKTKNTQSQLLLSLTSPPVLPSCYLKSTISNENNLVFEDITVKKCQPSTNQREKKYRNHISPWYDDQHEELQRCLLISCRDQANKNRSVNSNGNRMQRHSPDIWNDWTLNKHLSSSQTIHSLSNNQIDDLNTSESTVTLTKNEDDYDLLTERLTNVVSL